MKRVFAIAALVSAAAISVAHAPNAYASQGDIDSSLTVRYNDLDINTKAGAETLLHRIKSAAKLTCGGEPDLRELQAREAYDVCVQKAAGDAVQTVHSPAVNSVAADLG